MEDSMERANALLKEIEDQILKEEDLDTKAKLVMSRTDILLQLQLLELLARVEVLEMSIKG